MKTRTEKQAELIAKQAEEMAKFEKEQTIRELMPEKYREDASIYIHRDHASVSLWNSFRTDKKLADALEIVDLFADNIIQGEHWKSGCVSTWPAKINTQMKNESSVMDGSHEVEIDVHGGRSFGPDVTIKFWVDLPGVGLLDIHCAVCDLHILIPRVNANYGRHGELTSWDITWPQERALADSFRTWWSEKPAFRGSYYFAEVETFRNWASSKTPKQTAMEVQ